MLIDVAIPGDRVCFRYTSVNTLRKGDDDDDDDDDDDISSI
jgi:hypothetical protein